MGVFWGRLHEQSTGLFSFSAAQAGKHNIKTSGRHNVTVSCTRQGRGSWLRKAASAIVTVWALTQSLSQRSSFRCTRTLYKGGNGWYLVLLGREACKISVPGQGSGAVDHSI